MDPLDGVMKKCTLCIDRSYNQNLAEEERVPACASARPVSARHFGDFADPESAVSQLVAERGTVELLPEMGYRPTNAYLPPRAPGRDRAGGPRAGARGRVPRLARPGAVGVRLPT